MIARGARAVGTLRRVLLDLVFPPHCVGCRRVGEEFCPACLAKVPRIRPPLCSRCGRPLDDADCPQCRQFRLHLDGLRAVAFFEGPLRQAIHRFKYQARPELALPLGELLSEYIDENPLPVDVVVPVPLHPERERMRGFNQARLLAFELAAHTSLPLWYNRIERTRATPPQVGLDWRARAANLRGAFLADPWVAGKRVLLVDDVCTTGATLDACGIALKARGAKSVWGLALARGR